MRIFGDEKDRLQFIVDFVNRNDINETGAFTDADLEILCAELTEFLFMNDEGICISADFVGFAPKPTAHPFPSEFQKKDFIELQRKIAGLLDEISDFNLTLIDEPELWAVRGANVKTEGIPITVNIKLGTVVQGSTLDVVLFSVLMLIRFPQNKILRCPNWQSRICKQKFFLKQGKNVYCSSRCGNAYRVRTFHELSRWRTKVRSLAKMKMGTKEISRRLKIAPESVEAFLKRKTKKYLD